MNDILKYLEGELPRINAFLEAEANKLDGVVQPAVKHVLGAGGKRLRPLLALLTAHALETEADLYPLACSLELLHSATLLHDDILDDAELRRGQEAAHLTFGKGSTILAGDVLLALANRLVADYGIPRLTSVLSEAIMLTATGEVKEIANVRNVDLSRDDYMDIITGKTAYLFQAAAECGAILSGKGPEMEQAAHAYGLNLGIAFQLVDDALDYVSPSDVMGKPSGGDLREGKMTLPLITYLATLDEKERTELLDQLVADSFTDEDIQRITGEVVDGGHAEATRDAAKHYADKARKALDAFPDTQEKSIMDSILDFVISRAK
ncbi:polyprenyl synthetase family protein [Desulfovibrio ferrophilus]|uniref:Geranylgeranyl pyrophosphate synthase n=1 Tax=Desulfovibrio ferrophilus TaxID=241368 RepID=A0A2Z6B2E8_9BACT|nr:polyprenyl synthetase family protein [Desulfovibrio ferrophilus]BBD09682.1 geranylgeranyl pyrophosphate synthase [Desulfovibrio ferrophilus]